MRLRLSLVLLLTVILLSGVGAAHSAPRPAILTFTSSLATISIADAEAGSTTTTLSWRTTGLSEGYRLQLLSYQLDRWEQIFDPLGVPLEANGEREITVKHPLNFGPPTFLLSILDTASNSMIDQRVLSIPYDTDATATATAPAPSITVFAADVDSLAAADLQASTARVTLTWEIADRSATSQPVFEQVLADGTAISVELPRQYLWIPSRSQGPVAPVFRDGEDTITLRVRVVDLVTDEVYGEETLALEVTGSTPAPVATPAPTPTAPPPVSSQITAFTAEPDKVNPGQAVTLAWDVVGTSGVVINQVVPNVNAVVTVVNAQSPQGSATVYLPDYAAYSVTFQLTTAAGGATAQAVVEINCPYTFFFGSGGDGCPADEVQSVPSSYQEFENGIMLWRSDTNEIYVLYDTDQPGGTAANYLEGAYALLPDVQLSEVPPLNRVPPVAGFSKVWANVPDVRSRLGWGLTPEQGFTMILQDVAGTRQPAPMAQVYFTLPNGDVIGTGQGTWFRLIS